MDKCVADIIRKTMLLYLASPEQKQDILGAAVDSDVNCITQVRRDEAF